MSQIVNVPLTNGHGSCGVVSTPLSDRIADTLKAVGVPTYSSGPGPGFPRYWWIRNAAEHTYLIFVAIEALMTQPAAKRPTCIGELPVNETGIDMLDHALSLNKERIAELERELVTAKDRISELADELADKNLVRIGAGAKITVLADIDDVRQVMRDEIARQVAGR